MSLRDHMRLIDLSGEPLDGDYFIASNPFFLDRCHERLQEFKTSRNRTKNWGTDEIELLQRDPENPLQIFLLREARGNSPATIARLDRSIVGRSVRILHESPSSWSPDEVARTLRHVMLGGNSSLYLFAVNAYRNGNLKLLLGDRRDPEFLAIVNPFWAGPRQPRDAVGCCDGLRFRVSQEDDMGVAWDFLLTAREAAQEAKPDKVRRQTLIREHHGESRNPDIDSFARRTYDLILEERYGVKVSKTPPVRCFRDVRMSRTWCVSKHA